MFLNLKKKAKQNNNSKPFTVALIDFTAEKSRKSGTVENVDEFFKKYGMIND